MGFSFKGHANRKYDDLKKYKMMKIHHQADLRELRLKVFEDFTVRNYVADKLCLSLTYNIL